MAGECKANHPRITLDEARAILASRGWTNSCADWEDEEHVYAFAAESCPGTYGASAATVHWSSGYLELPRQRPAGGRYV